MSATRIATRYAKSLIDLANEQGRLDKVLEDVTTFSEQLSNRDLLMLIKSPVVAGSKKLSIIKELFDQHFDELTMLFFEILIKKGRERYLPEIAKAAVNQYRNLKQISTVTITTAEKLSDKALQYIKDRLATTKSAESTLEIVSEVDPNIIGGFIARYDDKILDASVLNKLKELKKDFRDNLYVSKIIAK